MGKGGELHIFNTEPLNLRRVIGSTSSRIRDRRMGSVEELTVGAPTEAMVHEAPPRD